ncbi:tRNA (cytidine(34)-2'-O)-methyltransferase, partial [Leifsonia sp. SIMBA_070]|uniref:tRNA (cytidine(34)-2'-O)-methyltransferase n=1 Tax=Leifsonia sp. SIMBA_070 TaxID=3085810 RepID=UPI00397E5A08
SYQPGDALMFGPEPTGLPDEIMADPRITRLLRIPMQPGIRSLNLSNSAAIATFEAWRQNGFAGGV